MNKKNIRKEVIKMKMWKRLVCMLSVAVILSVSFSSQGAALETSVLKANNIETTGVGDIPEEVRQEFDSVILKYTSDINSINDYVEDYIEDKGKINWRFRLPRDLKVKFNNIVDEFNDGVSDSSFDNDGINDIIIFPYIRFRSFDIGMGHYIWTDHLFTQLVAEYMHLGAAVVAAILDVAFEHGCTQRFLFFFASFLDTLTESTPDEVREKDVGMGIRWDFLDSYLLTYPAIIDKLELGSQ
jgi:hypothetical protein